MSLTAPNLFLFLTPSLFSIPANFYFDWKAVQYEPRGLVHEKFLKSIPYLLVEDLGIVKYGKVFSQATHSIK
jgi:hypothetical protein